VKLGRFSYPGAVIAVVFITKNYVITHNMTIMRKKKQTSRVPIWRKSANGTRVAGRGFSGDVCVLAAAAIAL
jgi:hypothetical protein